VEILNVPEVADILRTSETQVYRLIKAGQLPSISLGTRRRVISREDLDEFIRRGGVDGAA